MELMRNLATKLDTCHDAGLHGLQLDDYEWDLNI